MKKLAHDDRMIEGKTIKATSTEDRKKRPAMNALHKATRNLVEVEVIRGCEDVPLLTRWKLLVTPWFRLYLHKFHRSDIDRELHSHPWLFYSLILKNGYVEVRPNAAIRKRLLAGDKTCLRDDSVLESRRYGAGSILRRPAAWAHRVELVDGKPSWSLVVAMRKTREWGFFTKDGWRHWKTWHGARICDD